MKQRNANYDLMRCLAMIMVIMVHVPSKPFSGHPVLSNAFLVLIFTCNSLFYMLSGVLNLSKTFDKKEDYLLYYKKKTVEIVLPYVVFTLLLTLWGFVRVRKSFTLGSFLGEFYRDIMGENASGHLWFMYALMGMLLAAPFLAKMLQSLSDWALKLLLGLAIGWNIVGIYLTTDFGVTFAYTNWFLYGWIIHFVSGYAVYRLIPVDKEPKKLYIAAVAGFILNTACMCLFSDNFQYSTDLSPLFLVWGMGAWAFLARHPRIRNPRVAHVLQRIAKYSYLVYLVHFNVLYDIILPRIPSVPTAAGSFIFYTLATLFVSLFGCFFFDLLLISPAQRMLRKIMKI